MNGILNLSRNRELNPRTLKLLRAEELLSISRWGVADMTLNYYTERMVSMRTSEDERERCPGMCREDVTC